MSEESRRADRDPNFLINSCECRHYLGSIALRVAPLTHGDVAYVDTAVDLMLRVKEDDRAAFAVLYERYNRRVHGFFYGLSGDRQVSLDLGQETFLRIWKFRGRYAATGSFLAYLLTFARFVWLEHCRASRRSRGLPPAGTIDDLLEQLPERVGSQPDERARCSEMSGQIVAALNQLPEDQRMAFVLHVVQGLSTAEAASVMQCPVNTVRSRKILAVKKLRRTLRDIWNIETHRAKEFDHEV